MTTTRKSNFAAGLRTVIMMALLGALLIAIGYAIGGIQTATIILVLVPRLVDFQIVAAPRRGSDHDRLRRRTGRPPWQRVGHRLDRGLA